MRLINQIISMEFDRHPIAGNFVCFITLEGGEMLECFRQGGLGIWAHRLRPRMSREEQWELDQYLDARMRAEDEEGL